MQIMCPVLKKYTSALQDHTLHIRNTEILPDNAIPIHSLSPTYSTDEVLHQSHHHSRRPHHISKITGHRHDFYIQIQ